MKLLIVRLKDLTTIVHVVRFIVLTMLVMGINSTMSVGTDDNNNDEYEAGESADASKKYDATLTSEKKSSCKFAHKQIMSELGFTTSENRPAF